MKKIYAYTLALIVGFTSSILHAESTGFHQQDEKNNHYSWRPTDESQSKQAVGMVIWGFIFATTTVLVSVLIPNSTSSSSSSSSSSTSS